MSADDRDWDVPLPARPRARDYAFDLDQALDCVVALTARVPDDAHTAETLGTARTGNAVVIGEDNLLLTIGYLTVEATEIWLTTRKGRVVAGHMLGYDYQTGFALVQAQEPLDCPMAPLGDSRVGRPGDRIILAGAGGRRGAIAARIVARQHFAGYWEYVLDDAIFSAPAHPRWSGAALFGPSGELWGIGSLQVAHQLDGTKVVPLNVSVPVEVLVPILHDLEKFGRADRPPRPWLGLFAAENASDGIVIVGLAGDSPARRAGLQEGDAVLAVAGRNVNSLTEFFRAIWASGEAGADVVLRLEREGDIFDMRITSGDRSRFLRRPRLH